MVGRCLICEKSREANGEFCALHTTALRNLEREYPRWNKSFGGSLTRDEYYTKLLSLNETGLAAKEVISHARVKGESK
jgi:hypothetical protein